MNHHFYLLTDIFLYIFTILLKQDRNYSPSSTDPVLNKLHDQVKKIVELFRVLNSVLTFIYLINTHRLFLFRSPVFQGLQNRSSNKIHALKLCNNRC